MGKGGEEGKVSTYPFEFDNGADEEGEISSLTLNVDSILIGGIIKIKINSKVDTNNVKFIL